MGYEKEDLVILEYVTQITSFIAIFSGFPVCFQMIKTKSTYGVPFILFALGILNGCCYLQYGWLIQNQSVITVNIVGLLTNVIYVACYFYVSHSKVKPISSMVAVFTFLAVLNLFLRYFVVQVAYVEDVLGTVSVVGMMVTYFAPLNQVRQCIREQSSASLSLSLLSCVTVASSCWFIYGVLLNDIFIWSPNVPALLVAFLQMCMLLIYSREMPAKVE